MSNQRVRGEQLIFNQPLATTSHIDAAIQPIQRNCPEGNMANASAATELVIDEEAVLFRPRLSFVSED